MLHAKRPHRALELWPSLSKRNMNLRPRRGPKRRKLRAPSFGYECVIRRISAIYLFLVPHLSTACFTPSSFSAE